MESSDDANRLVKVLTVGAVALVLGVLVVRRADSQHLAGALQGVAAIVKVLTSL